MHPDTKEAVEEVKVIVARIEEEVASLRAELKKELADAIEGLQKPAKAAKAE